MSLADQEAIMNAVTAARFFAEKLTVHVSAIYYWLASSSTSTIPPLNECYLVGTVGLKLQGCL
jgi:hypothetical protein